MKIFPVIVLPWCVLVRRFALLSRATAILLCLGIAAAHAVEPKELRALFEASAGKKRDEKAGRKLMNYGDEAVPFLVEVLRTQEPHPVEYTDYKGKHKEMGTWSQDASELLGGIGTPLAIAEARKLAVDANEAVRFWGINVLLGARTERKKNLEFLRSRALAEHGRLQDDIVEELGDQRSPKDLPLFQKLAVEDRHPLDKLAAWYGLAMQGDKSALLEIVKVCEKETGHLGVVYLGRITRQDFEWDMKKWRAWIAKTSDEEFKKLVAPPNLAPAPRKAGAAQPARTLPEGTPEEVVDAVGWFDSLGYPSSKGLPRVQIVNESSELAPKKKAAAQISRAAFTGWSLAEDGGQWRILAGPDARGPFQWTGVEPWPLTEFSASAYEKVLNQWKSVQRIEKVDFKAEAEAVLKHLDVGDDDDAPRGRMPDRFGMVLSRRAATFILGHDCLDQGLPELGLKLLARSMELGRAVDDERAFSQVLAEEFAVCALWKISLSFGAPKISREALLAECEAALQRFPSASSAEPLQAMAKRLRAMIEDDRAHAKTLKPFDTLSPEEQAAELVFQLRDQNGHQQSQPGWCNIFVGEDGKEDPNSPAAKLVKLGHAAVPALIGAIKSQDYSRSVGFWRDFQFSHTVLTVGDCAMRTLERIANRSFYQPKTTSSYMSLDEQNGKIQADVEKWWNDTQKKSKKK